MYHTVPLELQVKILKLLINAPADHALISRLRFLPFDEKENKSQTVVEYKVVPKEELQNHEDYRLMGYTRELSEEQRAKAQEEIDRLEEAISVTNEMMGEK